MTQKALTLFLAIFALAPSAHAAESSGAFLDRIEAACVKELDGDAKNPGAVCGCVKKNYARASFEDADLEIMARSHEQDPKAEEELQAEHYEYLILFDYDVTEGCMKKPSFRLKK